MTRLQFLLATLLVTLSQTAASAEPALSTPANPQFRIQAVDDAWRAQLPRNAESATQAYLARLPPDLVKRSNAYFEGGYWLQFWNFMLGLAVSLVLLSGRRAARVRDWAQRVGRKPFLRDGIVGAWFSIAGWVLSLPLTVYQGFVREHAYGMATQAFGPWFAEQLLTLAVGTLVTAVAVSALYAVMRRTGKRWWFWGTGLAIALSVVMLLVAPVWIDPLFNTYKPVADGEVKTAVLAMAQSNGVPIDNVYQFDASRQTTRVSANVSGIFGSAMVRLNDNLLRTSMPEIRAVMGHELGHYVMNHVDKMVLQFALLILAGFMFTHWALAKLLNRHAARWGLRGHADVASLPLFSAVFSVFFFVATPVVNTITRVQEVEADRFGLNLARDPHGFAEVTLKLTEYRKPDPGAFEEFVFFDHPSARHRVHDAMRWREAMGTP
jgi:STE24 endopeptidase